MKAWAWAAGRLKEDIGFIDLPALLADEKAYVWIDLAHDADDELGQVSELLGLHPLLVEDISERDQRAKVEVSDDYVQLVMFALHHSERGVDTSEIDFVLGRRYLLTSHAADWDPLTAHGLRGGVGPKLSKGTDFVLWTIVDDLVDTYFPLFDTLADEIDELEDLIVTSSGRDTVERIFHLKRGLLTVRRVTGPQREIFNQLTNRDLPFVARGHLAYFRDVYDHLIRLTDELDSFQDRLTGALDAYLSTINNNLSEIMKRLTAVTVILAGIAAVGGIFGMSEAGPAFLGQEAWGFWAVTVAAVIFGVVGIAYLRRIGWL